MKYILCLIFFSFLSHANAYPSLLSPEPEPPAKGWKLKKETNNIKVYYRKSADSRVNEVKINTIVESSLSGLVNLLRDVPNYTNWIYKCEVAKPLAKNSSAGGIYYSELDFPWPLQNRDMIAKSELRQDKKTKVVTIKVKGQPNHIKAKNGIVRIEVLELTWVLTPLPDGKVHIDYQLLSDPGGVLPGWIINLAIDQGPTQTVKALRKEVQNKKYQLAELGYIEEL